MISRRFTISLNRTKRVITKSYHDRVSYDNHNKIFYIYHLGKYYNQTIYYYGETYDIHLTEYKIKKTCPFYENIVCIPVEDCVHGINEFENYISASRVTMPLKTKDNWDVFTNEDIGDVLDVVKKLYKITEEVS